VSFESRRRTREFGLRIALGASPRLVVRAVFRQGFQWTALGLACGTALSLAVGRALGAALYGITPMDPITYAGVFALLATASLIACYLPARRVAHIQPTEALRNE
jgi:ABC-type antimicrobial peptide transport system permease subunit